MGEDFCKYNIEIGSKRLKAMYFTPVFIPNALKEIEFIKNNPEKRIKDLKNAFKKYFKEIGL